MAGAPDDVVAVAGAPDDVGGLYTPDDRLTGARRFRAPCDVERPRIGAGQRNATRHPAVAPDDVSAPGDVLVLDDIARLWQPAFRLGEETGHPDRAECVQQAGALGEQRLALAYFRGVLQDRLHGVGCEPRVRFQHQCHGARHHRRRHTGSGQAQVRLVRCFTRAVEEVVGVLRIERALRVRQRLGADSGRDEVGFGREVDPGRSPRAEGRQRVVAPCGCPLVARRAHREHPRRIAGARDAAVLCLAGVVHAEVACSRDDYDARLDGAPGGKREWIGVVGLEDARGHRQIDDADVVAVLDCDRVVDCRDHVADVPESLCVEHFQTHQARTRRHAAPRAVGVVAVAGDDARHVRAVTVLVNRLIRHPDPRVRCHREVAEVNDARVRSRRVRAGQVQVVVPGRDSRIDHGDADPAAGQVVGVAGDRRRNRGARSLQRREHRVVGANPGHLGISRETGERRVVDVGDERSYLREFASRNAAAARDDARVRAAAKLHDDT